MAELEEKLREAACFGDIEGVKVCMKFYKLIYKTFQDKYPGVF